MANLQLTAELYANMVKGGYENLRSNARIVNDLNVFPVPDGDTGENMCMTIRGGATALDNITGDLSNAYLFNVAGVVAKGMLLSARGNSGVILSKFFEGIARGFDKKKATDARGFADALMEGVRQSYSAVMKPIEGTILTVCREATVRAAATLKKNSTLEEFFATFTKELKASLERTPEKLPVLKEAGVVDSGGAGLLYIADGMMKAIKGEKFASNTVEKQADVAKTPDISFDSFTENDVMEYGYCTEFLLRLQCSKVNPEGFDETVIKDYLTTLGDSVVIFKTDSIVKAHVHTLHPGLVLEFCRKFGEFLTVKIENMSLQHNSGIVEKEAQEKEEEENKQQIKLPPKRYGIVAVATGDGIKEAFRALGADYIVEGGQSMNPSAEDFITAFRQVNARTIIVLPNNGNVILAANQAAELYKEAEVRVLECKTIGDGYSALGMIDTTSDDTDEVMQSLRDAMEGVRTGMVSRAVRDANMSGIEVHTDDYIGIQGHDILSATADKVDAAIKMSEALDADECDIIIVISGNTATKSEAERLKSELQALCPDGEIIMMNGGQDVYDFILIYE